MKCLAFATSILAILCAAPAFPQKYRPAEQSDPTMDFSRFINGVRVAYLILDDAAFEHVSQYTDGSNAHAYFGVMSYLEEIGFEDVLIGTEADIPTDLPSLCDKVLVSASWEAAGNAFTNIRLGFFTCTNEHFIFEAKRDIFVSTYTDILTAFHNLCLEMYGYGKGEFNPQNRLRLPARPTGLIEQAIIQDWMENGAEPLEGVYEAAYTAANMPRYKFAVVRDEAEYRIIYLVGAKNWADWSIGELKAILRPSESPGLYKAEWYMSNKLPANDVYIAFTPGRMDVMMAGSEKSLFVKIFPKTNDQNRPSERGASSGSGFAIASNGLIATNYHVIEGAQTIQVRGIQGDFSTAYTARVVLEDRNNDLALLAIDDARFTGLGTVPYLFKGKSIDVGSSIFVLGYPLRASMGDEIKLTNGIISSKSGFQGDVTSYQISAPVQPGNSGGPLFDAQGNLVGIVNAKHEGAENVSYAVKASYLLSLIERMEKPPVLPTVSKIAGKPLTEQVKVVRKFTYIIETE